MYKKTTIDKIGNKTSKVKTFGSDKERISVLLGILAECRKLPPLIIFRGKPNGTIEKNLKKNRLVMDKKIFIVCQDNSWVNESIFLYVFKSNIIQKF